MPSFFQNLFKKESEPASVAETEPPPDRLSEASSLLSAMTPSSPFAAAAAAGGEQFTVRELTTLLPPQLVRTDALPGDQPVALPMDMLRHSMEQGRPALRLSQIYLACPFLFSRQVQPSEDVEIGLPWQKVKRLLDGAGAAPAASPFAAVAPPGARVESPFAAAGSPFVAGAAPASPFATRAPEPARNEVLSPFSGEAAPSSEAVPVPPPNPFQRMEAPAAEPPRPSSPFHLVTPAADSPPGGPNGPSPFAMAGTNGNGNGKAHTAPVAAAQAPVSNPFETNGNPPSRAPFAQPATSAAPRAQSVPVAVAPSRSTVPVAVPITAPTPPAPAPVAVPVPQPAPHDMGGMGGALPQRITVMLSSLLREVSVEELGFDPTAVPDHVEVELQMDSVLPQLSTGRVEISIEDLRHGLAERFRPAFARVRAGLRFNVPLAEIFKSLPEDAIPAPQGHVPIRTSPFQTPFAIKAEEDARGDQPALPHLIHPAPAAAPGAPLPSFPVPPALSGTPQSQSTPITLPSAPSAPATHEPVPTTPAPAMTSTPTTSPASSAPSPVKLPGMPKLPNIPGMANKPSPFSRPPAAAPAPEAQAPAPVQAAPFSAPPATLPSAPGTESHEDLGQPFSAGSLRAEPPVAAAPGQDSFNPAKLFAEGGNSQSSLFNRQPKPAAPAPAPAPAPVPVQRHAPQAAPAAPPIEFNFGETPDLTRVLMRAMFDTDHDLTAHQIVDRIAQLPGLRSALAIVNGGIIASGHESGSEEVAQFLHSVPKSCEYLAGLAESMGYGSSGSFTLRAGSGTRTIFIEGGQCLAVLHSRPTFAPGVRDKLLLTARTLGDLAD